MIAVYDANVLYPSPLRDLLIRLAIEELVIAKWSERILDEAFRSVARDRPDIEPARLERTRKRMCDAVLDCLIVDFEPLEATITLPDLDDRHVVAAAVRAGANVIVTFNLRDFPVAELSRHGLVALHPDAFVMEVFARSPVGVLDVLIAQAADLKSPPQSTSDVVASLERCGLSRFGAAVRSGRRIGG